MAYFDNAATTYPKPECVYDFMNEFSRNCGGSFGRGNYGSARTAGALVSDTREAIKLLLHCPAKQVVFEPSDTIALNIIIQGIIRSGAKNIYITPFEHNAVTRIIYAFQKHDQLQISELSVNKDFSYNIEKIRYQFEFLHPDMVIISHASNVIGLIAPAEEIFAEAKKYNAVTVLDMAQTAGLVDCNVGLETIDFATFAGHKTMLGPSGTGGFVMNSDIKMPTVLYGGTGVESASHDMPDSLPSRFEMGTMNICGIAGLNAAVKWVCSQGVDKMFREEVKKRRQLLNLLEKYDFIRIVGNEYHQRYVGIVSCLIDGISSDSAGEIFSQQGIAVRTGLHCAPMAHKFLGTFPSGTIRLSVNSFTKDSDFEELKRCLYYIQENL